MRVAQEGRVQSKAGPGKKQETLSKKKAKKGWSIAFVLEQLPSKHEALSLNSSTAPSPKQKGWQVLLKLRPKLVKG
jgi:hypothetical protein